MELTTNFYELSNKINSEIDASNIGEEVSMGNMRQLYQHEPWSPFIEDRSLVWGAAFRQYAPMESLERLFMNTTEPAEEGYSVWDDPQIKWAGLQGHEYRFMSSRSSAETMMRIEDYKSDIYDMEVLNNSGSNITASLAAGFTSPALLLGWAPKSVMASASWFKRFLGGALYTGTIMAPEEFLIGSQNYNKDIGYTATALTLSTLMGGSATMALGGKNYQAIDKLYEKIKPNSKKYYKSAGANAAPQHQRNNLYNSMENEALETTGIGVEKLPWNPITRMAQSINPFVRSLAPQMVDFGGVMQKKVRENEAMEQSVETTFRVNFYSKLKKSFERMDNFFIEYRGKVAADGEIKKSFQKVKIMIGDKLGKGGNHLTEYEFRVRIKKALANGDKDTLADGATPFIERSVKEYRKTLNYVKDQAESVQLFQKQVGKQIKTLKKQLDDVNLTPPQKAIIQQQLANAQQRLKDIKANGVNLNNGMSYVPRIWRVDKLIANEQSFKSIVRSWGIREKNMNPEQASKFADDAFDSVSRNKPYYDIEDGLSQVDFITQASSTKGRTLDIPDRLIDDFLENDIEAIMRHHVKTMGMDIELTRAFGDIELSSVLKQVADEYDILLKGAKSQKRKDAIRKSLNQDIADIKGLRDRLRGTYGASKDPHQFSSRFIRVMKSFNVITSMGGAVLSSVPDMARTTMVMGLTDTYEFGLKNLLRNQKRIFKKMLKRELDMASVAIDAQLGLRAHAFSDMGDLFGSRFAWERAVNQSTGTFFMMNGLNYWNQMLKEFAGSTVALKMTDSILKPWAKLTRLEREALLKNGIDQQMHSRMKLQVETHGKKMEGVTLPQTDFWKDKTAVLKFRNALNQTTDRIIVTPGAGERALWTSTEFGSLLTQFKGYGQGAVARVMTSGLQERSAAFWQGAFLMVGMGIMVNEMKKIQYGIDREEDFTETLVNAIDRSGITGWFMDINNAVEKISDFKLGLRPYFDEADGRYMPFGAKMGAVLGPAGSKVSTVGSIASDVLGFDADANTLKSARFLMPGGNLPYFDPILDGVFGQ
ncbi:putative internal virion protein D [uncultured Mediterranean phage uvMED]|nr:putative internal virion protein D [uncultured Mediterranean phage uvMED]